MPVKVERRERRSTLTSECRQSRGAARECGYDASLGDVTTCNKCMWTGGATSVHAAMRPRVGRRSFVLVSNRLTLTL